MKPYLPAILAAGLTLGAVGAASAQTVVTARQTATAVNSSLTTVQDGMFSGTITTTQEGANSQIAIAQEGSSTNAYVHQGRVEGASAEITQVDGHARATVNQMGGSIPGSGQAVVRQHFGGGEFEGNYTLVNQLGAAAGSLAHVEQVGDTLTASVTQRTTTAGTLGGILQVGGSNDALIHQSDGSSTAIIQQGSLGQNVYGNAASVTIAGNGNSTAVYQTGDASEVEVEQTGDGNFVLVHQVDSAFADINQTGSGNLIDLTQAQSGVSATLTQAGSGNSMTVIQ